MGSSSLLSTITKRLEGKVVLITGGASGIGECTAKLFSQHGAKVVIADIQDKLGHSVCKDLGPSSASYVHCNVTEESQVQNAIDTTVNKCGKLDIMFNNAGVTDEYNTRILDKKKSDFERVLNVNVTGVFLGMKHASRVMIPARSGSIISTASVSSVLGGLLSHGYTTSKHAVLGLTRNAAAEFGQYGIRVNCLSPYGVASPLAKASTGLEYDEFEKLMSENANLKGVILKAEDIANAALFLASDESRYISGHNLIIDGGFSIVNHSLGLFKHQES